MCVDKDFSSVDVVVLINSSYESLGIYQELTEKGYKYVQDMGGPLLTIGYIDNRPICIAPLIHEIGGAKVLHLEATSELVDWKLIDKWIKEHTPAGTEVYNNPTNLIINFYHYGVK